MYSSMHERCEACLQLDTVIMSELSLSVVRGHDRSMADILPMIRPFKLRGLPEIDAASGVATCDLTAILGGGGQNSFVKWFGLCVEGISFVLF